MKIIEKLLEPINTSVVSIFGLFTAWYGAWFLLPYAATLPLFEYIGVPTFSYGIFGITVGVLAMIGGIKGSHAILSIAALLGFVFWTYTAVALAMVSWMNPVWILALNWAVYAFFLRVNLKINLNQENRKYEDNLFE